jgi:alcohol dehydrogenase
MTALPMDQVIAHELEIYGSHGMAAMDYPVLLQLIETGALRPEKLIGSIIGLDQAGEAIAAMDSGTANGITVIEL